MLRLTVLLTLLFTGLVVQANPVMMWHGAGTTGGSGAPNSNLWSNPANWQIDGRPANRVPGPNDDVLVAFSTPLDEDQFGVVLNRGDRGGRVRILSLNREIGHRLLFRGPVTFQSLYVDSRHASRDMLVLNFEEGAFLTLEGSSLERLIFRMGALPAGSLSPIAGPGAVVLTGREVAFESNTRMDVPIGFMTPRAILDFKESSPFFAKPVRFRSDQTIRNLPSLGLQDDLISIDDQPLNNFSGVVIQADRPLVDATIAGGTYGAFRLVNPANEHSPLVFQLNGNVTLDSEFDESEYQPEHRLDALAEEGVPEGTRYSLLLNRRNRTASGRGNEARVSLRGYNLLVPGAGVAAIGQLIPLNEDGDDQSFNLLDLTSGPGGNSTAAFGGDLWIGRRGYIRADDQSQLFVRGNLRISSQRFGSFGVEGLTLHLVGRGTREQPILLEAPSRDRGSYQGDPPSGNIVWGKIQIGNRGAPNVVRLTNEFSPDDGSSSALYAHELELVGGSTLILNGQTLYVGGQQVRAGARLGDGRVID